MKTRIEKYNDRNWAVWLSDGEKEGLVCVTVYKKGALEVKNILDALIRIKGL
ncbi:MAG: hypothetical protein JW943_07810 [Deltaproteobacteria bacterium]|nr:hypothetical protein [Deltaproteobacteria bacterium]